MMYACSSHSSALFLCAAPLNTASVHMPPNLHPLALRSPIGLHTLVLRSPIGRSRADYAPDRDADPDADGGADADANRGAREGELGGLAERR